jgi:hypothetical protein
MRTRIDRSVRLSAAMFSEQPAFKDIEDVEVDAPSAELPRVQVPREPYVADADLVEAVNMAAALGRPLLVQGDPAISARRPGRTSRGWSAPRS